MSGPILDGVRMVVLALLVGAGLVALASWAVTARHLSPFGRAARLIRRLTDPVMEPFERLLVGRGGNPRHAPWWLLGSVILVGIVLLVLASWMADAIARTAGELRSGPRGVARVIIYYAGQLLALALLVRVVASWVGAGRYRRWMRPVYALTDWIVEPLRRIIPPLGIFDLSPMVAWLIVQLVVGVLVKLV
jgi:YggT family protein